jgi:hypothetical protein
MLAACSASFAVARDEASLRPREALEKATTYLWSQQREDGSWRSEQYAVMRSGQSLTPFLLHTLLHSVDSINARDADKTQRAITFIVDHLNDEGALGKADPDVVEYPVYSTAYSVLAFERWLDLDQRMSRQEWNSIEKMQRFLKDAQFTQWNGFSNDMAACGGWGFDKPQQAGVPGHMDLAHTRRAMAAVHLSRNYMLMRDSFIAGYARNFLAVVQKRPDTLAVQPMPDDVERPKEIPFDGGFYFSPVVLQGNKGRFEEEGAYWRSYATATCDGILALLAAGVPEDDQRVVAAVAWLKEHTNINYPQGIPTDHPEPWGDALKFYHYAVRAEVYDALDFPAAEKQGLAKTVAAWQRSDGSFVNKASPLMKEDDPVLCTALAVVALAHCVQ